MLALPKESLDYTAPMGVSPKVQPIFVSSKESLGYTEKKPKSSFASSKNLTPYLAPKDVKSSSIIEECFARVNKFGLLEFQYKGAKTYLSA